METSTLSRSLVVVSIGLLAACAKVADPQPPVTAPAPPLAGLQIISEGNRSISVEFAPAPRLERLRLFRQCPGESAARQLSDVSAASLRRGVTPGTRRIDDPDPRPDIACTYRMEYRAGGRPGETAALEWVPAIIAAPPVLDEPAVAENGISLTWRAPAGNDDGSSPARIEGYLVNGTVLVDDTRYVDRDFEWGRPASYRVQTVSRRQGPLLLSAPSEARRVIPEDRFPPEPPTNVTAVEDAGSVRIVWDPSPSADVAGYFVYRSTDPDRPQKSSPLVRLNRYTDGTPPAGSTVYYWVVAADERGNESRPSEPATVDRN